MLNDLRDSGTHEDNADVVILIHREDSYDRETPRVGEADLIVAKHRGGPTAAMAFQGPTPSAAVTPTPPSSGGTPGS